MNGEHIDSDSLEWLELFRVAVESAYDAVLITDADLDPPGPHIVYANAAFTRMTGYSLDEIRGQAPRILQGPDTDPEVLRRLRNSLEQGQPFEGRTVCYRRDGTAFDIEWRTAPMHDRDGNIRYFVAVQRDITAENRLLRTLRQQADYDPLTAIYNRRSAERLFEREIERARRSGDSLSVMLLDIDRFKAINDEHGHAVGDEVLKQLTHRIANRLRVNDLFARWGGEEFLIVLPSTARDDAAQLGETIREYVESTDFPGSISITVSIGVAEWRSDEDREQVIERADDALYKAKESGRNTVHIA